MSLALMFGLVSLGTSSIFVLVTFGFNETREKWAQLLKCDEALKHEFAQHLYCYMAKDDAFYRIPTLDQFEEADHTVKSNEFAWHFFFMLGLFAIVFHCGAGCHKYGFKLGKIGDDETKV